MKGIVVDASVAAPWVLQDEWSETSEWVLDQMQEGREVFVPSLWLLEVTNLIFNAERRKRIGKQHRDDALDRIERLPVVIVSGPGVADLASLRRYAQKYQLTAYDAEYLRVAKEMNLHLASMDRNLIAAARSEKVPLAQKPQ